MKHIRTFEPNDLISYHLEGTTKELWALVKDYMELTKGVDATMLVRAYTQVIKGNRIEQKLHGVYLKNIHRNFGEQDFREFINQNPEYFI